MEKSDKESRAAESARKGTVYDGMNQAKEDDRSLNPPLVFPYSNPTRDEYPVIAYDNDMANMINHPIENVNIEEVIPETLDSISGCGFNATILIWNKKADNWNDLLRTYYKEAADRGLRTVLDMSCMIPTVNQKYVDKPGTSSAKVTGGISYTPSLDDYAADLNRYNDANSLWGFNLMNAPEFVNWGYDYVTAPVEAEGLGGTADLAEAYRVFMQNVNRHVALFSLAVSTAKRFVGKEIYQSESSDRKKFERYLLAVIDRFNPTLLSVEMFPVIKSDAAPYYTIQDEYYCSLECIGRISAQSSLPFWMHMLCTQFKVYRDGSTTVAREYPLPTEGILRFQAMTAIAFGIRGLVFWAYALPEEVMQIGADGNEIYKKEFINSPYDNDGLKTEIWYNCAAVVPAIKLYGQVLMDAGFLEARHVYGTASSRDKFPDTLEFVSNMGCIARATASETGFVITRMEKGSDKYVVIVSHDPYNEQEISLTLYAGCRWTEYVMIDRDDSSLTERVHEKVNYEATVSRTLKPGGIILIKYEIY